MAGKTYDGSIGDLAKALINALLVEAHDRNEPTEIDKIRNHLTVAPVEQTLEGITALSSYMTARAAERQANAMESVAKAAAKIQAAETAETDAQAIVDLRESKRSYLASTYSLPSQVLSLLWAMRGVLFDASVRSLSRPDRFDPYRRVTTDEMAWTFRMTSEELWKALPRSGDGSIDFDILEEFDIRHYGGTDDQPDEWLYGG